MATAEEKTKALRYIAQYSRLLSKRDIPLSDHTLRAALEDIADYAERLSTDAPVAVPVKLADEAYVGGRK